SLLPLFLCLDCSPLPPSPHSFPTRRSSDLRGIRADDLNNLTSIAKNIKQGTLEGFDEGQGVAIGRRLADQLSLHAGDMITLVSPDRKSTRLNSSHVSISYAVFCLKKKKHTT